MIHQYQMDGLNIVLDVCSGGVHLVDEIAYDMIALYEQQSREVILRAMTEKYGHREDVTPDDFLQCYDEITALKEKGQSIVLIEHNLPITMKVCDRITVLSYGKKIAEGTPDEVKNDRQVIEAYLGEEDD